MQNREIIFRPLTQQDIDLLFRWVHHPHVAQWWKDPLDKNEFEEKYQKKISAPDMHGFIVYEHDTPIGYIQYYLESEDSSAVGIDLYIADERYLGKGFGKEIIQQFSSFLFKNEAIKKIIADPLLDNARSIRAFEAVGFKKEKEEMGHSILILLKKTNANQ